MGSFFPGDSCNFSFPLQANVKLSNRLCLIFLQAPGDFLGCTVRMQYFLWQSVSHKQEDIVFVDINLDAYYFSLKGISNISLLQSCQFNIHNSLRISYFYLQYTFRRSIRESE